MHCLCKFFRIPWCNFVKFFPYDTFYLFVVVDFCSSIRFLSVGTAASADACICRGRVRTAFVRARTRCATFTYLLLLLSEKKLFAFQRKEIVWEESSLTLTQILAVCHAKKNLGMPSSHDHRNVMPCHTSFRWHPYLLQTYVQFPGFRAWRINFWWYFFN